MIRDKVMYRVSLFTEHDIYLFKQGNHFRLYDRLGSRQMSVEGVTGTYFAVWAPNAERVSVTGDFNGWDKGGNALQVRGDGSGIWEGFVPGIAHGARYKYHIASRFHGYAVDKADPFASFSEVPPKTASVVWDLTMPGEMRRG